MAEVETKPVAKSSSTRWFIWILILVLAVALWLLYRGFGNRLQTVAEPVPTTPVAGGMAVDAATAAPAATTAAVEPTQPPGLQPGATVAASGDAGLRLYADANLNASIMDVYAAGALFTVLEPSDSYGVYPIEADNRKWYRLRAADGLVGWAHTDSFTPASNAPQVTSTPAG